jgi:tryptophan-rich sensory protein
MSSRPVSSPARGRVVSGWLIGFGSVIVALAIGGAFPPDGWFEALRKPTWQPPAWLFAPVWTTLYVLMGISFSWLLNAPPSPQRRWAIALFALQLAFNAAWSPLFFGLQSPLLALLDIIALWLALIACIAATLRVHSMAGWLLLPVAAWVSFALVLNGVILALN